MDESVWDYPRPPRVEPSNEAVRVVHHGRIVAESTAALRVLETSHPPGIYIPAGDCDTDLLQASPTVTVCEFKGQASYVHLVVDGVAVENAAWVYRDPRPGYEQIRGCFSFYPGRVDACFVGDERVTPQEGGFYGGWITSGVSGPFKGSPGTRGW
ncbi:MAG: DUF427 domain-containing protein [Acidimicrobiia bacterium]|nr:DUF427 domain-containing protein [Acidimicrobiia bacterium]